MDMPRKARRKSESNIYHIMLRGINQQQIFLDKQDNFKFIEVLKHYKDICGYKIFAYCIMGNHIHLLMKFDNEPVEQAMKRICVRFVYWYNAKYQRIGHLFQDRFRSEPIEDDSYFLMCLRYIHQNPVKAHIAKIDEYPYSSYNDYICSDKDDFVDVDMLYSIISREQFIEFSNEAVDLKFIDITDKTKTCLTDEEAIEIILRKSKCKNISEFKGLDVKTRDKCLSLLKNKGLGTRQISRLTGLSYYIVQKS